MRELPYLETSYLREGGDLSAMELRPVGDEGTSPTRISRRSPRDRSSFPHSQRSTTYFLGMRRAKNQAFASPRDWRNILFELALKLTPRNSGAFFNLEHPLTGFV